MSNPSQYLQGADLANFGVPNATVDQITQASLIIDSYCNRPEGLLYTTDAGGLPCYMSTLNPSSTFTSVGSIAAGASVSIPVNGPFNIIQVGQYAVFDRSDTGETEGATVISSSTNPNTLIFDNLKYAHSAGCTIEFGMGIFEEIQMPTNRPITNFSRTPIANVLSGQGRYGYGRVGNSYSNPINQYNLLAAVLTFGGPPIWETFEVSNFGVDPNTGQVWIPAGILLAYYDEIRVNYISGFQYSNLPAIIKQACANIINALVKNPFSGNVKSYRAGDTQIERFGATYIDADTKTMISKYRVNSFY